MYSRKPSCASGSFVESTGMEYMKFVQPSRIIRKWTSVRTSSVDAGAYLTDA